MLLITVGELTNKFKVGGSVARKLCKDFLSKNLIKQCGDHHASFTLYSGAQAKQANAPVAVDAKDAKATAPVVVPEK